MLRGVYWARGLISTTLPAKLRFGKLSTVRDAGCPVRTKPSLVSGT